MRKILSLNPTLNPQSGTSKRVVIVLFCRFALTVLLKHQIHHKVMAHCEHTEYHLCNNLILCAPRGHHGRRNKTCLMEDIMSVCVSMLG